MIKYSNKVLFSGSVIQYLALAWLFMPDKGHFFLAPIGKTIGFCLIICLSFISMTCEEPKYPDPGHEIALHVQDLNHLDIQAYGCACNSNAIQDAFFDCINSCADSLILANSPKKADSLLSSLLTLLPDSGVYKNKYLGEMYFRKGKVAYQNQNLSLAISHLNKSITLLPPDAELLPEPYKILGFAYEKADEWQKSYSYMEKHLQFYLENGETDNQTLVSAYYYLGKIASMVGEMEKAEEMLLFATDLLKQDHREMTAEMAKVLNMLGNLYYESNQYSETLACFEKSKAIFSYLKNQSPNYASRVRDMDNNLAVIYDAMGDYKTAIELYEQIWLQEEQNPKPRLYIKEILAFNQALAHKNLGNFNTSLKWFEQAEQLMGENAKAWDYALLYTEYADFYQIQERYKESITYSHKSICLLAPASDTSNLYTLPDLSRIEEGQEWELQKAIYHKANTLLKWYEKDKTDTARLQLAMGHYACIPKLMEIIRKSYHNAEDQLFLNELAEGINTKYAQAITCAHYAWQNKQDPKYLEFAHSFMERHKAMLLLESLLQSREYKKMYQDRTLRAQGDEIKNQLNQVYSQLIVLQQQDSSASQEEIRKLNQEIHRLEIKEKQWLESLEQVREQTDSLNYTKLASIQDIQNEVIQEGTIVISYFLEDSTRLHTLSFDNKNVNLNVNPLPDSFLHVVRNLIKNIQSASVSKESWDEFTLLSSELYQVLIEPVTEHFKLDSQRFIIVPDGLLAMLPFEVLLSNNKHKKTGVFKTLPYLAKNHPVSYAPSLTLLYEQQNKYDHPYAGQVLGLAYSNQADTSRRAEKRFGSSNSQYDALQGSFEEVSFIQQLIKGKYRIGSKANKNWFLQHAEQYGIIHLAIHGTAANGLPKLIFRIDSTLNRPNTIHNELFLHEIYTLHLQSNLTVLSACETGKGLLADGEGILSLARGFTHAGAHSVLMSLWKADDHASAQIMKSYYQYLSDGLSKDQALFEAKRNYLDECGPYKAHPSFWAAFILQGNREMLDIDTKSRQNISPFWYGLLFILITGFLLIRLRILF